MGDPLKFLYSEVANRKPCQEPHPTTSAKLLELELFEIICQGIDPRTGEVLETPFDPLLAQRRLAYLEALRRVCGESTDLSVSQAETSSVSVTPVDAVDYVEQLLSECRFNSPKSNSQELTDTTQSIASSHAQNNTSTSHPVSDDGHPTNWESTKRQLQRLFNFLKLTQGPKGTLVPTKKRWKNTVELLRIVRPRSIYALFRDDRYDWLPTNKSQPLFRDERPSQHSAATTHYKQPAQAPSDRITERKPSALIYLKVPFNEKNEAKALGAMWDAYQKQWYVPHGKDVSMFERWHIDKPRKSNLKSKLSKNLVLFVDLVPRTAWFSNLRSELTKDEWESVKKTTFTEANYRCQACGGRGPKHPVECHERWHYDSDKGVQSLIGTIALCPSCHEATHFGLAQIRGRDDQALKQLTTVNNWTEAQAEQHINEAMNEWKKRSELSWRLDARWLIDFVTLSEATQKKILDHAEGLAERAVLNWQKEVIIGTNQHIDRIDAVR